MTSEADIPLGRDDETFGDELPKGTTLLQGQYTLTRFLNAGGFGITYLAKDSLDRTVVIKECFPSSMCCRRQRSVRVRSESMQEDFKSIVKCFGQEARALAKLAHPNIVGVHQVFEDNQTAYMALDFVKGQDLLDLIEYEPDRLSPDEIRRLLIELLDAVAYIHDQGVLHRDISPDNILIDDENQPVLIDFGAAREEVTRRTRMVTQQATVKDGYSPQEFYIAGAAQTPASDLYALAATFYHLIAGEAPPISQLRLSTVAEGSKDPYVPLRTLTRSYDRNFLAAIDICLSIFPKDRLESAHDWLRMIEGDVSVRPQTRVRSRPQSRPRTQSLTDLAVPLPTVEEEDEAIQAAIHELVRETNKAVEEGVGAGEPVKKTRVAGRVPTRARDDRWKKFRDLNEGVTDPEPERALTEAEDAAVQVETEIQDGTDTVSTEEDVVVRKRTRTRRLFGRMLGGMLRRGARGDSTAAGVAER